MRHLRKIKISKPNSHKKYNKIMKEERKKMKKKMKKTKFLDFTLHLKSKRLFMRWKKTKRRTS